MKLAIIINFKYLAKTLIENSKFCFRIITKRLNLNKDLQADLNKILNFKKICEFFLKLFINLVLISKNGGIDYDCFFTESTQSLTPTPMAGIIIYR